MGRYLTADERETVVTTSDAAEWVYIDTFQRRYMTKLKANPMFEVVVETEDRLQVRIPADQWNPAQGAKRTRNLTPEARAEAGQRLAAARTAKTA